MTLRYVYSGVTAVVIAGGLMIGSAYAQLRDGGILPAKESGEVTVTGCLLRGDQITGGDDDKYVLASPTTARMATVPEAACSAGPDANALELDNPEKANIDDSMLGRWVEISGRLEREGSQNPDNLRELDVLAARVIPVEERRAAAVEPFIPAPEPAPEPAPAPVATSGQEVTLPKTASPLPLAGLIGLFACAGGLVVRSFRRRA